MLFYIYTSLRQEVRRWDIMTQMLRSAIIDEHSHCCNRCSSQPRTAQTYRSGSRYSAGNYKVELPNSRSSEEEPGNYRPL
jgi:hypothetical protein